MAILSQEKVLTLDYWKLASKLQVGDYVFDKNGRIVQITLAQPVQPQECFEVVFDDHLRITGDKNLRLGVENKKYRERVCQYKGVFQFRRPLKQMSAQELSEAPLMSKKGATNFSVPTAKAIQMPHQDLPVPPFVFGFWFFARRNKKTLAPPAPVKDQVHSKFKDHGYKIREHEMLSHGVRDFSVTPKIEAQFAFNPPIKIPNNYLLGSIEQRTELLQGILCGKHRQYNKKDDFFRITNKNFRVITQIQGLVESLGIKTRIESFKNRDYYTLHFKSRIKLLDIQESPRVRVHVARRYIKEIRKIPSQMCVHIETNGDDNSILVGEGFISCH